MEQYILSVDNGGTYIKAAVFDAKGYQVGLVKKRNHDICLQSGWSEYDQDRLWKTNCVCMQEVLLQTGILPEQVAGIGICGQGCGVYAVGEHGESIRNAISSSDTRAIEIAKRWNEDGTDEKMYPYLYRYSTAGHANAILAWLKKKEPESYRRIVHVFSMKEFLVYRLTGKAISGYGCESVSGFMNISQRAFDPKMAEAYGMPEMIGKFGKLYWDIEKCGYVTAEAAKECGCLPGTPVSSGCHDVVAAALAMGLTADKDCFLITGTHGINGCISDQPVLYGSVKYNELFAAEGKYLLEDGYPASSATLEWVISVLFSEKEQASSNSLYEIVNREVVSVVPDEEIPLFLPFLKGYRDNPKAAGCWVGLKPFHTRAHLLRAVYEGVAYTHLMQMQYLRQGRTWPDRIHMAGGATNSAAWIQIFADIFEVPMEVRSQEEMGAKGAAIAAAVAVGWYPDLKTATEMMVRRGILYEPQGKYREQYRRRFKKFKRITAALDAAGEEEKDDAVTGSN